MKQFLSHWSQCTSSDILYYSILAILDFSWFFLPITRPYLPLIFGLVWSESCSWDLHILGALYLSHFKPDWAEVWRKSLLSVFDSVDQLDQVKSIHWKKYGDVHQLWNFLCYASKANQSSARLFWFKALAWNIRNLRTTSHLLI